MSLFHTHKYDIIEGGTAYCKCGAYRSSVNPVMSLGYEKPTPYKEPDPTPQEIERVRKQQAESHEYHTANLEAWEINTHNSGRGQPTHYRAEDVLRGQAKRTNARPTPLVTPTQVLTLAEQIAAQEEEKRKADYQIWLDGGIPL